MPFTILDKIACLKREIRMREHVYLARVERKQMTAFLADREIALMRAILSDYEAKHEAEKNKQTRLF